jgi:hypothetical protein
LFPVCQDIRLGELRVIHVPLDLEQAVVECYVQEIELWAKTDERILLLKRDWHAERKEWSVKRDDTTPSFAISERRFFQISREEAFRTQRPVVILYTHPNFATNIDEHVDSSFILFPGPPGYVHIQAGKLRRSNVNNSLEGFPSFIRFPNSQNLLTSL